METLVIGRQTCNRLYLENTLNYCTDPNFFNSLTAKYKLGVR